MTPSQIILVPVPAQGHIPPMFYLSKRLAEEGFTITVINIQSIHETLQKSWIPTPGQDIRLESIPFEFSFPNGVDEKVTQNSRFSFKTAIIRLEEPLAELIKSIHNRGPKVACVISDFFHSSAALSSHRAGFPSVAFFPGAAAWAAIDYHIPKLISNGAVPVQDGDDKFAHLPGITLRSQDFPSYLRDPEVSEDGTQTLLHRLERVKLDSRVLVNSVYDFEPEVFDAMKVALDVEFAPVGPLFPLEPANKTLPVSLRVEDMTCLEWLDKQAPNSVLYVSFGSIAALPWKQVQELALGLEASEQHFLWVNRPGSESERDEDFYQSFLERVKDRGLVTDWSPQLQVLQHGSTGGFLTHAGWNSVFESICAGVPMLGYPCLYDQFLNTRVMLEEKGMGLSLVKGADGTVSRKEVEKKVKALMKGSVGEVLRGKTEEFAKLARKAAKPGGSSHSNLKNFVSQFLL